VKSLEKSFESESKETGQMVKKVSGVLYSELDCNEAKHEEEVTKIGAKLLSKGNKELLARRGGGEAGNTGAWRFGMMPWEHQHPPASASCSRERRECPRHGWEDDAGTDV
jgi:hypothetical protein